MLRVSRDQLGLLHDQTVQKFTRSALPWLRENFSPVVEATSDADLSVKIEKIVQFSVDANVTQERNVRSIIVFHLEQNSEPDESTHNSLRRLGFSENERVADYINSAEGKRTKVRLDNILPNTGGVA